MGTIPLIIILALLVLIVAASSGHTALDISEDLRRYRKYYAVLGFKIGDWRPLPEVVGVTLKHFSTVTKSRSRHGWEASVNRSEEVVIMLSVRDSNTGFIISRFSADNANEAIGLAQDTAKRFNVPVNNYLS
jgi:hypothetical protein